MRSTNLKVCRHIEADSPPPEQFMSPRPNQFEVATNLQVCRSGLLNRIRVLYLSHTFAVGGAEEMVLNLVRHLPPRFEPAVTSIGEAGPIGEEIRRTGVAFAELHLTPGIRRPLDLLRLRRHLREVRPTIVHTFLLTASLYGRAAAVIASVPIVIGTEVNVYERKRAHHALTERMLMARTDAVVASAESVKQFYVQQIGADAAKVEVIYNAVDWSRLAVTTTRDALRASIGVPPDAIVAGIIARLTEQKGHRMLFDAVAHNNALAQLHLVVVGGGELDADLRAQVDKLGLTPRVHFVGPRRDLGDLLASWDLFVMPSFWEGLPLSLVLAMGAGLPVVATRVAGIPEVVHDGATGLLVEPGDRDALGAALARVVTDRAFGKRLGDAARAFAGPRFGVDGYVNSVVGLYDRLLAAKGLA
jgi:glycosyltransferase involved in cell wall biosynthesis